MAVTRALIENPSKLTVKLIPRALIGLIALLCGNAYIVGINQIYDVKIDEVVAINVMYEVVSSSNNSYVEVVHW